jgi:hypothetical protein
MADATASLTFTCGAHLIACRFVTRTIHQLTSFTAVVGLLTTRIRLELHGALAAKGRRIRRRAAAGVGIKMRQSMFFFFFLLTPSSFFLQKSLIFFKNSLAEHVFFFFLRLSFANFSISPSFFLVFERSYKYFSVFVGFS